MRRSALFAVALSLILFAQAGFAQQHEHGATAAPAAAYAARGHSVTFHSSPGEGMAYLFVTGRQEREAPRADRHSGMVGTQRLDQTTDRPVCEPMSKQQRKMRSSGSTHSLRVTFGGDKIQTLDSTRHLVRHGGIRQLV